MTSFSKSPSGTLELALIHSQGSVLNGRPSLEQHKRGRVLAFDLDAGSCERQLASMERALVGPLRSGLQLCRDCEKAGSIFKKWILIERYSLPAGHCAGRPLLGQWGSAACSVSELKHFLWRKVLWAVDEVLGPLFF